MEKVAVLLLVALALCLLAGCPRPALSELPPDQQEIRQTVEQDQAQETEKTKYIFIPDLGWYEATGLEVEFRWGRDLSSTALVECEWVGPSGTRHHYIGQEILIQDRLSEDRLMSANPSDPPVAPANP